MVPNIHCLVFSNGEISSPEDVLVQRPVHKNQSPGEKMELLKINSRAPENPDKHARANRHKKEHSPGKFRKQERVRVLSRVPGKGVTGAQRDSQRAQP